jgi:hypothetical protein
LLLPYGEKLVLFQTYKKFDNLFSFLQISEKEYKNYRLGKVFMM